MLAARPMARSPPESREIAQNSLNDVAQTRLTDLDVRPETFAAAFRGQPVKACRAAPDNPIENCMRWQMCDQGMHVDKLQAVDERLRDYHSLGFRERNLFCVG